MDATELDVSNEEILRESTGNLKMTRMEGMPNGGKQPDPLRATAEELKQGGADAFRLNLGQIDSNNRSGLSEQPQEAGAIPGIGGVQQEASQTGSGTGVQEVGNGGDSIQERGGQGGQEQGTGYRSHPELASGTEADIDRAIAAGPQQVGNAQGVEGQRVGPAPYAEEGIKIDLGGPPVADFEDSGSGGRSDLKPEMVGPFAPGGERYGELMARSQSGQPNVGPVGAKPAQVPQQQVQQIKPVQIQQQPALLRQEPVTTHPVAATPQRKQPPRVEAQNVRYAEYGANQEGGPSPVAADARYEQMSSSHPPQEVAPPADAQYEQMSYNHPPQETPPPALALDLTPIDAQVDHVKNPGHGVLLSMNTVTRWDTFVQRSVNIANKGGHFLAITGGDSTSTGIILGAINRYTKLFMMSPAEPIEHMGDQRLQHFRDTSPEFMVKFLEAFRSANGSAFSFVYFGIDGAAPTQRALEDLHDAGFLPVGCVLVFERFWGYAGWEGGQYAGLEAFSQSRGRPYSYLLRGRDSRASVIIRD